MDLTLQNIVMAIVAVSVGMVLLANLLIPLAEDQIAALTNAGLDTWAGLLTVVVTVTIIGLMVAGLSAFLSKGGKD